MSLYRGEVERNVGRGGGPWGVFVIFACGTVGYEQALFVFLKLSVYFAGVNGSLFH